jgi:hypothetical protein
VEAVINTKSFARNERHIEANWLPVGDALGDAIASAIAGKSDSRSALNEAQSRIVKIHKDHSKQLTF